MQIGYFQRTRSKKYFKGMTDIKGIEDTKGTNKY